MSIRVARALEYLLFLAYKTVTLNERCDFLCVERGGGHTVNDDVLRVWIGDKELEHILWIQNFVEFHGSMIMAERAQRDVLAILLLHDARTSPESMEYILIAHGLIWYIVLMIKSTKLIRAVSRRLHWQSRISIFVLRCADICHEVFFSVCALFKAT